MNVVEVDLGSVPRRSGRFDITTTGLTTNQHVIIEQINGPYTNKGTLADEAEMDQLSVTAQAISSTVIRCYWTSPTVVRGNIKFAYTLVSTLTTVPEATDSVPGTVLADMLSLRTTEVSITGATTLTSTAFGKMHVCSGTSADYTVKLPTATGNAGKTIGFRMSSALTKLVTIQRSDSDTSGTGLIDTAASRVMWAQESAILLCDGTTWTKIAGKTRPMIGAMRSAAVQTLLTSAETKVTFDTADVDIGALVSLASDNITIRRAGTYTLVAQNTLVSGTAVTRVYFALKVNGVYILYDEISANASQYPGNSALTQYALAVGDVLELWAYHTTGVDRDTASASGIHSQPKMSVEEKLTW